MKKTKPTTTLLKEILFFIGGIFLIAVLYQEVILLTSLILIFCIIQLTIFKQENDLYYFLTGLVFGPMIDLVAVSSGAWEYTNASIYGLPLWLPLALGMVAVSLKRIAESLIVLNKK